MSVTVRLIFWGLIGFVPNPGGEKGLTALLVDPNQAQAHDQRINPACAVPRHFSVVYLFDGECVEGNCRRIPQGRIGDSRLMGFDELNGANQLAWLLDREGLEISGDEDDRMKLLKPRLGFIRRVAPTNEEQGSYFKWVQSMDKLTGGRGEVRPDCLQGKESCPLNALFNIQGGTTGACHLFHTPEPQGTQDGVLDARVFEYTIPGRRPFRRVVADAVLVEFEAPGDSVFLRSRRLPGGEQPEDTVRLKPDSQGKLTLIVANFPPRTDGHGEASHEPAHGCAPPHSDILFRLLAQDPKARATRREDTEKTRPVRPGSCEPEATRLAQLLSSDLAGEPPHSSTACDGSSYP